MSEIDRLLRDSLGRAGAAVGDVSPERARKRFAERRRGRLRLRFVALASAAALVVAGVGVLVAVQEREVQNVFTGPAPSVPAGDMLVTARIDVGANPTSIDTDGDKVYVGHASGGRVTTIDPVNGSADESYIGYDEEFQPDRTGIPGQPRPMESDLLVVEGEHFWAAGNGGLAHGTLDVQRVVVDADGESVDPPAWLAQTIVATGGRTTDIEVGPGAVYLSGVARTDAKYEIAEYQPSDLSDDTPDFIEVPVEPVLATHGGIVWATQRGERWTSPKEGVDGLLRIDFENLEEWDHSEDLVEGLSGPTDVSAGAERVWVYESPVTDVNPGADSSLVALDPASGAITESVSIPGWSGRVEAMTDLGVFVMVTGVGDNESRLHRVDPATGDKLGEPLTFDSPGPFSMTSGFGSLWIADEGKDAVYRVEIGTREEATLETKLPPEEDGEGEPEPPKSDSDDFVTVEIDTDPPGWAPSEGCLAGPSTPQEDREWVEFIKGTEPTSTCPEKGEEETGSRRERLQARLERLMERIAEAQAQELERPLEEDVEERVARWERLAEELMRVIEKLERERSNE